MGWMGLSGGAALGTQWLGAGRAVAGEPLAGLLDMDLTDLSANQAGQTRWEQSAQRKRELTKDVTWFFLSPLDYHLRRGNHSDDEPEQYRRMIDPDNLKRMADAGVVWNRIFFYMGFGLEYEKPHIEQAKRAIEIMHGLGMKVSVYVAGTMFTETLYRELPEAESWEQRDCWGHWVPYGIQTYRHYPCINQPAYEEYLKRVMRIGIQDVGADELAFDQIMLQPEPRSCRCARCIEAFGAYLRQRYPSSEAARRRFGLPDVDWIRVNQWDSLEQPESLAFLDDPVLQEWTRFRCESLAKHGVDLYNYAKSLNPNVSVSYNMKGVFCFNRYWRNAVYHPLFTGHVDRLSFDTGGYGARIDPVTGALVSQIRSYKMARRIGSCSEESGYLDDDEVRTAVHMAFSYQKPVCTSPPLGPGAFNVFTSIMEFFREYNDRYYTETDNVTDVAVLLNWPSMAYSISATWIPATLMEQILIQYKVPFDLLFDEQLDHIGRYAAVILAGQECVSDAQAALLMRYVRDGGTLVVSGSVGQFNEWREDRRVNALPPARREGKGRIVYIPEIIRADAHNTKSVEVDQDPEPGLSGRRGIQITPAQWVLPKNHEEVYKSIMDAMPGGLSLTTEAPLTTVMELLTRPKTHETIAHFINFDRKNRTDPFVVTLRKQFSGSIKSVTCMTPEMDSPINLSFKESGGSVKFAVPAIRVYAMMVVAQ